MCAYVCMCVEGVQAEEGGEVKGERKGKAEQRGRLGDVENEEGGGARNENGLSVTKRKKQRLKNAQDTECIVIRAKRMSHNQRPNQSLAFN